MTVHGILLSSLNPAWEPVDGSDRLGLTCNCPRHPWGHCRVLVFFENPPDGSEPDARASVVLIDPDQDIAHVTLIPAGGYPPDCCIVLGHWRGWLADGVLTESFIGGVGW